MAKAIDVVIIGAGAAGMLCAARAGQAGLNVVLLDHAHKVGEKIRISGGGRCNFTNVNLNTGDPSRYFISQQPRFVRHALARFTPNDFMQLLQQHGIAYHEKHKGQMFCQHSAQDVVAMLQAECARGQVQWQLGCHIHDIQQQAAPYPFVIHSNIGTWHSRFLVVATGGLAVPAIGATAFGYEIAKQFGHSIITPEAALVPLRFEHWQRDGFADLAGVSLPVAINVQHGKQKTVFQEDLLFRHKGLSGPAILQISSYWQAGQTIHIDLCPEVAIATHLCDHKHGQKIQLNTALRQLCPTLPERLLHHWLNQPAFIPYAQHKWADVPNQVLQRLGQSLNDWCVLPSGSDGHKKAEVTRGGVNVKELDSKTMQSKLCEGLFFVGEVMDITGWLGGYNFQWAWASAVCAADAMSAAHSAYSTTILGNAPL